MFIIEIMLGIILKHIITKFVNNNLSDFIYCLRKQGQIGHKIEL